MANYARYNNKTIVSGDDFFDGGAKKKAKLMDFKDENIKVVNATTKEMVPSAAEEGEIALVYWNIRGLGQPCRLSLAYAGAKFTDVRVDPGECPGDNYKKMWMDRKAELASSVPFPNLPYLLDASKSPPVAMVQTRAILRHIARKYDLLGDDLDTFDMMLDECTDFDDVLTGTSYRGWATAKSVVEERLKPKLDAFAAHLTRTGLPFLTGNGPSVVDFKFFDTLSKLQVAEKDLGTEVVASNAGISEYIARVKSLPAITAYLASPGFIDRPFNNPHAQFK